MLKLFQNLNHSFIDNPVEKIQRIMSKQNNAKQTHFSNQQKHAKCFHHID